MGPGCLGLQLGSSAQSLCRFRALRPSHRPHAPLSLRCSYRGAPSRAARNRSGSSATQLHAMWPMLNRAGEGSPEASSSQQGGAAASVGGLLGWAQAALREANQLVLYPWDPRQQFWTAVATLAAALSGLLIPWEVAFEQPQQLYNLASPTTIFEGVLCVVFALDMLFSFRTAYYEGETVVDNPREIARQYLRSTNFLLDLLGVLPWDLLALVALGAATPLGLNLGLAPAAGAAEAGATLATLPSWVPLLKLLHMVRLYRVRALFQFLEYNLSFSLLNVTIVRNMAIVLYITHWAACGFFWEAQQSGFDPDILIGADAPFFASLSLVDQYIYSLYWAVTTLSTVDFGDNVPSTMPQTISAATRASLFMLFNIALGSYILGTITLLVVKNDERTGKFRDQSASLRQYTTVNNIPHELKESMQGHLRLHFETDEASDEQVLSIFPTPIRRRIMRYLYIQHLRNSYLFKACPTRFMDAVLSSARIEVFMPGVDILSSGDQVNELLLLLNGSVEFLAPDPSYISAEKSRASRDSLSSVSMDSASSSSFEGDWYEVAAAWEASREGGRGNHPISATLEGFVSRREAAEGSLLGEAAFFTEVPQLETVRSTSVCRVMVVSRAAYGSLERSFPAASRQVLQNLVEKADQAVGGEFHGLLSPQQLDTLCLNFEQWQYAWGSAELIDTLSKSNINLPLLSNDSLPDISAWTAKQQQAVANLLRIRSLVKQYITRQDIEATTEFLYAASHGNIPKIRQMIQHGCKPDMADYDGRTALELACVKGHTEVAAMLLRSGANPNLKDNLGSCALLEACKYGHDDLIKLLKQHGARLGDKSQVEGAAELCTCVFEGNLPLLRRLISAGIHVDSADYDKRTALHISAAEGNLQAVKLLINEGGADIFVRDRWGYTPLDEARRVGALPVVNFLESCMAVKRPRNQEGLDGWGI